ncbi:MAG: hypothetical protein IKG79_06155, partial [Neisseriaceae bacterium]|nr:hypothetical protein [Neisseriaceae bacterium]
MKNFLMIALLIAMVVAGIVAAMYFLGISVSVDSLLGKKQSQEAIINNMSFKKIQDEQEALLKQQYGEDWDKP